MAYKKKYRTFSEEESAYLKELTLSGHSLKETAELFNERYSPPISEVKVKAWRHNHHTPGLHTGQFKNGGTPWNKGKHFEAGGNSKYTRFQKGSRPWTTRKVGDIVQMTSHGKKWYWKVKVAEPDVWKLLHVKVWEDHNGPVPHGCIIRFFDGDFNNCDIKNLYCISRKENATFNHLKLYPANEEELQTARLICRLSSLKSKRRHKKKGDT